MMRHEVIGGEEIMTIAGKGRLVVENTNLFFNNGGINYPISARDILQICIAGEWFGILSFRKLIIHLDARVYLPKSEMVVA